MTIVDEEICLNLGQVSLSLLCLLRKLPDGHMWSGVRLTKRPATSRPDHLRPQNMEKFVKELQNEGEAKFGK